MYCRTVVASALIRLLRLVTLSLSLSPLRLNDALIFAMLEIADRHEISRFYPRRVQLARSIPRVRSLAL